MFTFFVLFFIFGLVQYCYFQLSLSLDNPWHRIVVLFSIFGLLGNILCIAFIPSENFDALFSFASFSIICYLGALITDSIILRLLKETAKGKENLIQG